MDGNENKQKSVRDLTKEKRTLINNLLLGRQHIMKGYTVRHNEELHSIILESKIQKRRKKTKNGLYKSSKFSITNQRYKSQFV